MEAATTERIRNVTLLGHGAGKTTLAEALLHCAGAVPRLGRVEDGTTTCDTEPESTRRGMSLANALAPFDWTVDGARFRINLIDTPGHDDFAAVAASSLAVADLAVIVVSATDGVEPGTERAWAACERHGVPRLMFVAKEDKPNADFHRVLADVQARFGSAIHALELPIGELGTFRGVADLLADTDTTYDDDGGTHQVDAPPEIADEQHELHDALVEDVVTDDDDQLERYLAGDTPTVPELERTLAHEVLTGTIVPSWSAPRSPASASTNSPMRSSILGRRRNHRGSWWTARRPTYHRTRTATRWCMSSPPAPTRSSARSHS